MFFFYLCDQYQTLLRKQFTEVFLQTICIINISMTRIKLHVVSWQHSNSTKYLHNNTKDYADFYYKKTAILNTDARKLR